jgi:PIN domain nuclease of toxin-antitoxin system
VKVVADSQVVLWYLNAPRKLSEKALRQLEEADQDGCIVVSAVTVPELWMAATRKQGPRAVSKAQYAKLKEALEDPSLAFQIEPLDALLWQHFEEVSLRLQDPFDAMIVATALELDVPLVSADSAIAEAGLVHVVW